MSNKTSSISCLEFSVSLLNFEILIGWVDKLQI